MRKAPGSVLAELMLPDGAHNRDHDWTIFFLNQAGAQVGPLLAARVAAPRPR